MHVTIDVASALTALSLVIVALTGMYTAVTARRTLTGVKDVHAEVKTANGITAAVLLDRQEGRRIEADVPAGERTDSEQHYVDQLHGPTDHAGNPLPPPPIGDAHGA